MKARHVEAKSQANLRGKSKATWEIPDRTGPLSHFMRSKPECFVNIPTAENSSNYIQPRLHFAPYKCLLEPQQKFSKILTEFVTLSDSCDCSTCKLVPKEIPTNIPVECWPDNIPRSAGYSLLVDVLNAPTDNLTLTISVKKLNGVQYLGLENNLVILEPNSPRKDIPMVDNFRRTVMWTVDKFGKMENCGSTYSSIEKELSFQLTVKTYQMEITGTDTPKLPVKKMGSENAATAAKEKSTFEPQKPVVLKPISPPKWYQAAPTQLNTFPNPKQFGPTYEIPRIAIQIQSNCPVSGYFYGQNSNSTRSTTQPGTASSTYQFSNSQDNTGVQQPILSQSVDTQTYSLGPIIKRLTLDSQPGFPYQSSPVFHVANGQTYGTSGVALGRPINLPSSNTGACKTTNPSTIPQFKIDIKRQPSGVQEKVSAKSTDKSAPVPQDDAQSSSSSTPSDTGSDFEVIQPPNKPEKTAQVAGKEEVEKMQQDLQNLFERMNKLKQTK